MDNMSDEELSRRRKQIAERMAGARTSEASNQGSVAAPMTEDEKAKKYAEDLRKRQGY